jgi:hypothetical protein
MSTSTPLKLRGTNGDLQQLNSTEENYLAYLTGLQLASSAGSDPGDLTLVIDGHNVVGTFVDTYFNEAVGTHPASAITSSSISTTLYQRIGTASESGADFRRPVAYNDQQIVEMNDTQFNELVDRLNSRIVQSDYPGIFKLGSSSPGVDYTTYATNIFSDTDTDGTVTTYNLYRRTTMSAPTSVKIMSIKRSGGATGDYQGIQEMTVNQMQYSLGQRAKTRKAVSGNIGNYALRSSSQGAPSTGTWRAVGTATNTKKTTAEIDYTRTSTRDFLRTSTVTFTRDSINTFSRNFAGNFVGNYTRDFTGNYARAFTGDYVANFIGEFTRVRPVDFARERASTFTADYVGNYTRNALGFYARERVSTYAGNFAGEYARNRTETYTREFTGDYARGFAGEFIGNYSRNTVASYSAEFTGDYTRGFTGDYTRNRGINYQRNRVANFAREIDYIGDTSRTAIITYFREPTYIGNYAVVFTGNYTSPATSVSYNYTAGFHGIITGPSYPSQVYINGTRVAVGGYNQLYGITNDAGQTFDAFGSRKRLYGTLYGYGVTATTPGTTRVTNRDFSYVGNYTANIGRNVNVSYAREINYVGDTSYAGDFIGDYVGDFIGNYSRLAIGNYTRTRVAVRNATFVGDYSRLTTRTSIVNYSRLRVVGYTRTFVGDYARTSTRTGVATFIGDYARGFTGDYTRNRTAATPSTFIGNYIGEFVGDYSRDSTVNVLKDRTSTYARNRLEDYTRDSIVNRASTYTGNFIGDYARGFTGDFTAQFVGNYVGTTIQSSRETIETYTLYVRTA